LIRQLRLLAANVADGPTGQRPRECSHIRLRVAAAHAERVQLQNFPRKIFVDVELSIVIGALRRALRNLGVRADGRLIVQVQDHGRMRFHGQQQIDKPPAEIRPDDFILQRRGQPEDLHLVGGNSEVIGPKMHQALAKRLCAARSDAISRSNLLLIHRRQLLAAILHSLSLALLHFLFGGGSLLATLLLDLRIHFECGRGRGQRRHFLRQIARARNLFTQPAARVIADVRQFTWPSTEAKTIGGNNGSQRQC